MTSYNLPIVASGNTIAKKNRSSVLDLTLGDLSNKKCHIVNAFIIEYFSGYQFPRTVELELWHKFGLTGQRPWSVWQDKRVIWLFCKLRLYYHMDSSCIKRKKEAGTWLVFWFLIIKLCVICYGTIGHCINNSLHLARIFVCRHYLLWKADSFLRVWVKEICERKGTDNVQEQNIRVSIFSHQMAAIMFIILRISSTRAYFCLKWRFLRLLSSK